MAALRDAGLLRLKVPAVLGGDEAEPDLQFDVFERVALTNASAAWCLFIYADSVGLVCSHLPDAGVEPRVGRWRRARGVRRGRSAPGHA